MKKCPNCGKELIAVAGFQYEAHCGNNQTIIEGNSLLNQTEYLQCSDCKKYFRLRISITEINKESIPFNIN